jgi:hypothetical protein
MLNLMKYWFKCIKWLWKHRNEADNRQKFRRMEREIMKGGIN